MHHEYFKCVVSFGFNSPEACLLLFSSFNRIASAKNGQDEPPSEDKSEHSINYC